MKKILLFLLISNFLCAQWSISDAERNALLTLYNATGGPQWSLTWDEAKDPKTWYGIKVKNGAVTEINLRGNALKGAFPTGLSTFTHLQKLDLSSNQLSGELSSSLGSLTGLTRLDLSNNRLTGDPALALAPLHQLTELSLGNNFFVCENINTLLQNFTSLKILDLSNFGLTAVPDQISTYNALEILNLSNNTLKQNFEKLSPLSQLRELDLSGNQLTAIPPAIANLTPLTSLNLAQNKFTQNTLGPLANLTQLEWLSLEDNEIENLPTGIAALVQLVHLNLGRNKIAGGISSLQTLTHLEQLYLHNNKISGAFPEVLLQLPRIQMVVLTGNQLSGNIPANIPPITLLENNRYSQGEIKSFLDLKIPFTQFAYSPQRYDHPTAIQGIIGESATLPQQISGEDYRFRWYKTLETFTGATTSNYHLNSVQDSDFDAYTCEAYFLKKYPDYLLEISFFREPVYLQDALATQELAASVALYPNPTQDYLHISTQNNRLENALIYDLSGRQILTTKAHKIDVRAVPSGVYVIVIKTQKGNTTLKWIKN